jgi:hypothetical protein
MTYPIPNEALDDRLGWIGTAGSGKTYNAGGGVERLLQSGARVVIVDPLDVWWGLRLQADGQPSPFNAVIFGGEHGDLPLNEQAGALIGETVATMGESCIVSLGGLNTKSAERRFMLPFLESLYGKSSGDPVHVVFDEADMWAPQTALDKGDAIKILGMMETIVRRGRVRGFIPWLITQRPAVLNKNVLSQVDGLIAFKLTASQDREAIGAWIDGQADRAQGKEILATLPTMQRGTGVVWVPGRGILETIAFPAKATFDSSRTPKRGERKERRDLKPLNLEALRGRLTSIEDETKANDPKALKAEVARLTRELAKAERSIAAPPAPVTVTANQEQIDAAREEGQRAGIAIGITRAQQALAGLRIDGPAPVAKKADAHVREKVMPVIATEGLTGPQQKIVNAIGWWKAFGIGRPSHEQVAFVAGYSPGSGGFNNLKGGLRSAGLIDYPEPGKLALTDQGEAKADIPGAPPTQDAFHASVRAKLSGPQVKVLDPAINAYPSPISSDDVAAAAGYSSGSGGYNNLRGSLRTIGLIDYPSPGMVRAADWLFPA